MVQCNNFFAMHKSRDGGINQCAEISGFPANRGC